MIDYWVVLQKTTGKVIVHCGEERDAIMMVSFDLQNRIYRKQKFIMDHVINVSSSKVKELPGQVGLPEAKTPLPPLQQETWLPEGKQIPLNSK